MKLMKLAVPILLMAFLVTGCGMPGEVTRPTEIKVATETSDYDAMEPSDPMRKGIEQRCGEIVSLYSDLYMNAEKTEPENLWDAPVMAQSGIDVIENHLINEGLDVMDTNGQYPSYLTTAENFYAFWDAVKQRKTAQQEVISIRDTGALIYRLFTYADGAAYVYSMRYPIDGISEPEYEKHEVLDWELTEKGNFYYRIYPAGDVHYADYTLIRLSPPDLELQDFTTKYIRAGGYIGTNLFLTDWTENDWGDLSFNDLWEFLYFDCYGSPFLPNEQT